MVTAPERRIGRLILAAPLSSSQLRSWFDAFRGAQEDVGSGSDTGLTQFRSALVTRATEAGLTREAEEFLRYLDTQGSAVDEDLIRRTSALADQLPAQYEELGPVSWITDEQWDQLEYLWNDSWPQILRGQLQARWPDGASLTTDEMRGRLDHLIPEFYYGPTEAAETTADPAGAEAPAPAPPPPHEIAAADLLAVVMGTVADVRRSTGGKFSLSDQEVYAEAAKVAASIAASERKDS